MVNQSIRAAVPFEMDGHRPREPVRNWHSRLDRLLAWLIAVVARLPILLPLWLICLSITAAGLGDMFQFFDTKLWNLGLPYLERLKAIVEFRRLTIGHVTAFTVFSSCWYAWEQIISFLCYPPLGNITGRFRVILAAGSCLLLLDATVFFFGIYFQSGSFLGSGSSAFVALLVTALYVCLVVIIAYRVVEYAHRL